MKWAIAVYTVGFCALLPHLVFAVSSLVNGKKEDAKQSFRVWGLSMIPLAVSAIATLVLEQI